MAITFPSPGGQTPSNTFSPTSSPAQTTNGLTYVYNPTLGAWISTSAGSSAPVAATLAEAAAGTLNTVFLSPQTGVPKDASGMTGAAILPSGTNLQRAAITTPVVGMQRFNTDSGNEEVYTGVTGGWKKLEWVATTNSLPANYTVPTGAQTLPAYLECNDFTVTSGATITPTTNGAGSIIVAYGNVTINASTWNYTGTGPRGPSVVPLSTIAPVGGTGYMVVSMTTPGDGGGGVSYAPQAFLGGSAGGGCGTIAGGNASSGGNGGGYIIIRCYGNITLTGTVTMNAKGGSSVVTGNGGAGGSGGGGGVINLHATGTLTTPSTVTFDVSGGNASTSEPYAISGCGGGGGGWVILESPNLVDSSVKVLTGGNGGPAGGSPTYPPIGGAGSAGAGGNVGSANGVAGSAGGTGIFATAGSVL
jgi:hypothetical protein